MTATGSTSQPVQRTHRLAIAVALALLLAGVYAGFDLVKERQSLVETDEVFASDFTACSTCFHLKQDLADQVRRRAEKASGQD